MEIRKTQQSLEIAKVETDQRTEVSKLKPVVPNQIPDSFEDASLRKDSTSQTSSTGESAKADPKSQELLLNKMTTTRLLQSGIKTQENPITIKKELGTDEQNAANIPGHKVPNSNASMETFTSNGPRVPKGAYTGDARSRIGEADQALRDLVANGATDLNPKNDRAPSHGGPSGTHSGAGNPLEGGPTGPSNPLETVNQKYEQASKMKDVNSPSALGNFQQVISSVDQASSPTYGKDMVAYGAGTAATVAQAAYNRIGPNYDIPKPTRPSECGPGESSAGGAKGGDLPCNPVKTKGADTADGKDPDKKEPTPQKTPGASTQSEEQYQRQELEKHKEEVRNALGDIGIDPFALPKRPIIQGDIDPPEDQQTGGEYQPGLLQQFGKDGLIGNPTGVDSNPSGGSVNLGSRGSNIDYENGSGYMGSNRTQDPQDVDVSGGPMERLIVVSRDQQKDEEEKSSRVSTQKKK